jgi:putative membrane protein
MFHGFHEGMGAGGWVLMSLFWVAFLAVVVWVVARVVPSRKADDREPRSSAAEDPFEILDRRLARGEIDVETYDQLRSKLSHRPLAGNG